MGVGVQMTVIQDCIWLMDNENVSVFSFENIWKFSVHWVGGEVTQAPPHI